MRAWIVGHPDQYEHVDPAFARGLADRFGSRDVAARAVARACASALGDRDWQTPRPKRLIARLADLASRAGDLGRIRFEGERERQAAPIPATPSFARF